ncbi:MAG: ornithine--oxo-acid transaminase [Candidatus Thermoplasmatota archaeon]|nr:ornithine--oxo-acid transaminase [Euryarchaeota archaeon]MBU4033013.1 ornithine--oxo-acid transaminase [Candidatus Thermoplasmatota archaeon]MBU4070617.1 ornithine--oxo-acid transaminase [Candidatus Thermoplasmatota archaeon]MBU4145232.1 ornithine--oxo-acid transaminase [Candidatus Thermoplasmatota archaeon]MBU4592279.1 ornithine--oxo-acid transaminase [Candidatus Thermoplasmatota archaeon]
MPTSQEFMKIESKYGAHNYHPIPVVICKARGIHVWDPEGRKYMDMLSSYSALNQGHCHPKILKAANQQMKLVTLTSRAFYNDKLGPFMKLLTEVSGMDVVLPMNTGAEAVETGIKLARKWGYKKKGIPENKAEIIVCEQNFHGRTTTIVGFSSDFGSRDGFGPFPAGFKAIPYNDTKALEAAITPNTAAFLVEPIQGEAGVIVPSPGYLKEIRRICTRNNVLLMLDEVQTGFCRTGKMFCFQHDGIKPDILLVGKALGGGVMPVSAAIASKDVMSVMTPGDHGSTFGGNPLACAVATASLEVLLEERLDRRAAEMGEYFMEKLRSIKNRKICDVRGKGLLIAIQLTKEAGPARQYTEALKDNGLLAKETHETTIRFAPPLVITKKEIDRAVRIITRVLK